MKIVLVLAMLILFLQANNCEKAMENAVRVCMKYAETNVGYRDCLKADNNTTKKCKQVLMKIQID